jgi:hypothetical protein
MASSERRDDAGGKSVRKRRRKNQTGVIAVKGAGTLPRQARARGPLPVSDEPTLPDIAAAVEAAFVEPMTGAVPEAMVEDITEKMSVLELAALMAPDEEAPALADVIMAPLDGEPPPEASSEEAPPTKGMSWLLGKLRRWSSSGA